MRIGYNNAAIVVVLTSVCLLNCCLGLPVKKVSQHFFGESQIRNRQGPRRSCSKDQRVRNDDSFACTNTDENEITGNHQFKSSLDTVGMKRRNALSAARSLVVAGLGTITPIPLHESSHGSARAAATVTSSSINAMDSILLSNQYQAAQDHTTIMVPLEFSGDAYIVSYQVGGTTFRAVLDTGSPFLMIPGSCSANTRSKSGCYQQQGSPSGLEGTIEIFDGFIGEVEWRKGSFAFPSPNESAAVTTDPNSGIIFGVVDDNIMSGPGGVFFGLIKNTAKRIRPSFLGQTNIVSFAVDLRSTRENGQGKEGVPATTRTATPSLMLSTLPLLSSYDDYIPLNYDLRKKYGDPVQHYVAKAKSLIIDGRPLIPKNGKPIYIILDTGVTGMVVNNELFEQRYNEARANKEKRLWGGPVEIMLETKQKKSVSITAQKPLTTRFDPKVNWKGFNANLMVVGLSFLNSRNMIVDIDDGKMWLED
ncbi:unnamed protein product [Cylindrotheca closterium]|uniref:Peptidase A1 domain-containing protein n=1 Tax=Cylindrotheca closterium TaxID=2856 RepID=A0AAD2JM81_9STRA|nr:unnamed protein product [Cylindrotheca closterium]